MDGSPHPLQKQAGSWGPSEALGYNAAPVTRCTPRPCDFLLLSSQVLQPQVQSLVTSSQVQPVAIQQQVQTVQAPRVLTQTASGTLQTLAPATVQTVAAPQVQQVPVGGWWEFQEALVGALGQSVMEDGVYIPSRPAGCEGATGGGRLGPLDLTKHQ